MKRFIAIVLSAGFLLSAQAVMAFNGNVVSGVFSSEQDAIAGGTQLANMIKAGEHRRVQMEVSAGCQNPFEAKYTISGFTVEPVWVDAGSDFTKAYQADVKYQIDCEMPYGR